MMIPSTTTRYPLMISSKSVPFDDENLLLLQIHDSIESGDEEAVKRLIEAKTPLNKYLMSKPLTQPILHQFFTPLHSAISKGKIEIMKLLIEKGADLKLQAFYHFFLARILYSNPPFGNLKWRL